MTDRELLEAAAKAAGIEVRFKETISADYRFNLGELPYMRKPHKPEDWDKRFSDWCVLWNPLTDDGDALRLALAVGLELDLEHNPVTAGKGEVAAHEWRSDDAMAATRRAIVRAAAAITPSQK